MSHTALLKTPCVKGGTHPIYRAPRRWAEQTYKRLIYWPELERGGHFAALEQPELFVNELRAAFHQPLFRAQLA